MLKRRTTAYYVLTGSGFLLEYKDGDPILHPDPVLALKLSDCELGNAPSRSGKAGFTLRGKDSGKSIGRTHEYVFRTDSMEQATQWWNKLEKYVGAAGGADDAVSDAEEESPISPSSVWSGKEAAPGQGVGGVPRTDPVGKMPVSAAPYATAAPVAQTTATPATTTAAAATGGAENVYSSPTTTTAAPTKSAAQSAAYHATHPAA